MTHALPILAIVLVLRWFSLETGRPLAVHVSYGWTPETCEMRKAVVDAQPDPAGMQVSVDCLDDADLPHLLAPGSRT